jgi:F-type H+-transporting ATPase subunit delta
MSDQRLKTRPDSVLEDPGALAVAGLYARSYLTAAQQNSIQQPQDEMNSFVDEVLVGYPEFAELLTSDVISREDKLGIVERIIVPRSSEFFANFVRVLIRHGRFGLISLIRRVMVKIQEEAAGKRRVGVRTARSLSDESKRLLSDELKIKLGFEPILQESVDESLIGGLIIQVGDTVYDSSLRSRLKQLSGRLVEKALNEIQIGRDRFSHPERD